LVSAWRASALFSSTAFAGAAFFAADFAGAPFEAGFEAALAPDFRALPVAADLAFPPDLSVDLPPAFLAVLFVAALLVDGLAGTNYLSVSVATQWR
jgi:hypothetical protein